MEVLVLLLLIYIWFASVGIYVVTSLKKLKGLSNAVILYSNYSFILSLIFAPISVIQVDISKYLLIIWFIANVFLYNTLQRMEINKFDILAFVVFVSMGVIEVISKISIFFSVSLVYIILYTTYYVLSSKPTKEAKKSIVVTSVYSSLGVVGVILLTIFNVPYYNHTIVILAIVLSQLTTKILLIVEYSKETDTINNNIGMVLMDKENKIREILGKMEEVHSKIESCLSSIELEKLKLEKSRVQEFVKEIASNVTELFPIVDFIEKVIKEYQSKTEEVIKKLPGLSEDLNTNFSRILSVKEALSDANVNIMSLVKVALDSEKSVMNVSKSIKELRDVAKTLTNNLVTFKEISDRSSILSINISVEASKLGSKGLALSKISQEAKSFSETIFSNVESIKKLIKDLDSKAEFSEYMVKTLVMSFIEIETTLKNTAKNVSSIIEKFEMFSSLANEIERGSDEINKMMLVVPELSMKITRRLEDVALNYKKLKKYSGDTLSSIISLENSIKVIIDNINSMISFINSVNK
ncbi:MAG: methyl-accepting chemotaxis protein [Brevinematia bacterium]